MGAPLRGPSLFNKEGNSISFDFVVLTPFRLDGPGFEIADRPPAGSQLLPSLPGKSENIESTWADTHTESGREKFSNPIGSVPIGMSSTIFGGGGDGTPKLVRPLGPDESNWKFEQPRKWSIHE